MPYKFQLNGDNLERLFAEAWGERGWQKRLCEATGYKPKMISGFFTSKNVIPEYAANHFILIAGLISSRLFLDRSPSLVHEWIMENRANFINRLENGSTVRM